MAKIDVFKVEGFNELNQQLKKLPDSVKRREVLAIQRKLAKPIQQAYAGRLPQDRGTLSKSVAIKSVSVRRSGGNPSIQIMPGRRGKHDAYYRFMVIRKGTQTGGVGRGSRKAKNTVVTEARNRTLANTGNKVAQEGAAQVARLVQKKIDKLSK